VRRPHGGRDLQDHIHVRGSILEACFVMKCPTDHTILMLAVREGIEIDYCPTCRGVWLDRGELDKIIERSATYDITRSPQDARVDDGARGSRARDDDDDDYDDDDDRDERAGRGPFKKRRKGFLGDLFEFGD
jgi:Zn-finger nucleic acid-binding protein